MFSPATQLQKESTKHPSGHSQQQFERLLYSNSRLHLNSVSVHFLSKSELKSALDQAFSKPPPHTHECSFPFHRPWLLWKPDPIIIGSERNSCAPLTFQRVASMGSVPSTECLIQSTKCPVPSIENRVPISEYRVPSSECQRGLGVLRKIPPTVAEGSRTYRIGSQHVSLQCSINYSKILWARYQIMLFMNPPSVIADCRSLRMRSVIAFTVCQCE
jgi:hypothetical protein